MALKIYLVAESAGERQHLPLAYVNMFEYFFFSASFLIAPFIGGCSTVRLVRSSELTGFPKIIGWLLIAFFALEFSYSSYLGWLDCHRFVGKS